LLSETMPRSAIDRPATDPTPIFEAFRGNHATELLTAAVAHLGVFARLAGGSKPAGQLRQEIGLEERPHLVLMTALRALGLVEVGDGGLVSATELAREHLTPGAAFDVTAYIGLAAESPGVLEMVERLRTNRPAGEGRDGPGAAYIFREGIESAMDQEATARGLTLALAGRARNVAPVLAGNFPLDGARLLLDVGGGTGIYAIAWLQRHPELRAIVWDRPEVLKVAREMAQEYGVADRLETVGGDMFRDPVPPGADVVLLSNVLHDWDVPECQALIGRCSAALPSGGWVLIHDVFLNDDLAGPLPVALFSAALFRLTEGRAYSAREYREWLVSAGLVPQPVVPTLIHFGVLAGLKP
jgi:predicted O-methyltransferase YrrM